MSRGLPPNPTGFRSLSEWAQQFYEFFLARSRVAEENDPLPVLLPHRTSTTFERATPNGILLYDPVYNTPVVSVGGEWEPTRNKPLFELNYEEAANDNGVNIGQNGDKIPFNAQNLNGSTWGTFNSSTTDFTLFQGQYYIDGYVSITKAGGGAKSFTGYLAKSSDLTTPVGSVKMGSLTLPANAVSRSTDIVPFSGQVSVPQGGDTYAMVVFTEDNNTRFGTAHGITGYLNVYGRLSVTLIGLNE